MPKPIKKYAITESVLWGLKMCAPLILIVIIEQRMGPGSSAKASQLFPFLLIINLLLGSASLINLIKAMNASSEKQES